MYIQQQNISSYTSAVYAFVQCTVWIPFLYVQHILQTLQSQKNNFTNRGKFHKIPTAVLAVINSALQKITMSLCHRRLFTFSRDSQGNKQHNPASPKTSELTTEINGTCELSHSCDHTIVAVACLFNTFVTK